MKIGYIILLCGLTTNLMGQIPTYATVEQARNIVTQLLKSSDPAAEQQAAEIIADSYTKFYSSGSNAQMIITDMEKKFLQKYGTPFFSPLAGTKMQPMPIEACPITPAQLQALQNQIDILARDKNNLLDQKDQLTFDLDLNKSEMASIQKQLADLQAALAMLEKSKANLQVQYDAAQRQLQQNQDKIKAYDDLIAQLKQEAKSAPETQAMLAALQAEKDQLLKDMLAQKAQYEELQKLASGLSTLDPKYTAIAGGIAGGISGLVAGYALFDKDVNGLIRQNQDALNQLTRCQNSLDPLRALNDRLQAENNRLTDDLKKLTIVSQHGQIDLSDADDKLADCQKKLEAAQQDILELKSSLLKSKAEASKLQAQLNKCNDELKEKEALEAQWKQYIDDLTNKGPAELELRLKNQVEGITQLQNQINELKNQLKNYDPSHDATKKQLQDAQQEIKRLSDALNKAQQNLAALQARDVKDNNDLEAMLENLKKQIGDLGDQLAACRSLLNKKTAELDDTKKRLADYRGNEQGKLQDKIKELEQDIKKVQQQSSEYQNALQKCNDQLVIYKKANDEYALLKGKYTNDITALERQIDLGKTQLIDCQNQLKIAQQTALENQNRLTRSQAEYKKLNDEYDDLMKKSQGQRGQPSSADLDAMKKQLQDAQNKLKACNDELALLRGQLAQLQARQGQAGQPSNAALLEKMKELETRTNQTIAERKDCIQQLGKIKDELKLLQQKYNVDTADLEQQIANLKQQVDSLKKLQAQSGSSSAELSNLQQQLKDAQLKLGHYEKQIHDLQNQIVTLQQAQAAHPQESNDEQVAELQQALEDARKKISALNSADLTNKNAIDVLKKEAQAAYDELAAIQKEDEGLKAQNKDFKDQLTTCEAMFKKQHSISQQDIENATAAAKADAQKAQQQLSLLQQKYNTLEQELATANDTIESDNKAIQFAQNQIQQSNANKKALDACQQEFAQLQVQLNQLRASCDVTAFNKLKVDNERLNRQKSDLTQEVVELRSIKDAATKLYGEYQALQNNYKKSQSDLKACQTSLTNCRGQLKICREEPNYEGVGGGLFGNQ